MSVATGRGWQSPWRPRDLCIPGLADTCASWVGLEACAVGDERKWGAELAGKEGLGPGPEPTSMAS